MSPNGEIISDDVLMPGEEGIEVEIVDDRPENDRVEPRDPARSADGADFEDESVDNEVDEILQGKRIKRIRYEFHEERRAREAAERQRDAAIKFAENAREEAKRVKDLLKRGEKVLVDEVRARTKSDVDQAKARYRRALEDGDPDRIVEAQEAISRATFDARQAESYQYAQPEAPEPDINIREEIVGKPNQRSLNLNPHNDPKLQTWLDRNDWFGKDDALTSQAVAIHTRITTKEGISPTSDEYYKRIDREMRSYLSDQSDPDEASGRSRSDGKEEPARKKPSQVVAPASRSAAPAGRVVGNNPNKVRLTSSEADVARRLGLTPQQYAAELVKLEGSQKNAK